MEQKKMTGYPSVDKPWLKYYSEKDIAASLPDATLFEYLYQNNKTAEDKVALNYFGNRITFKKMFFLVEKTARSFVA